MYLIDIILPLVFKFWPHGCFGAKVRGQCKDGILTGPSQSMAIWRVALKNPSTDVDWTDGAIVILYPRINLAMISQT